jgi:hypothetical protein
MAKARVEVIYALPSEQRVVTVELEEGATAADAVAASGLKVDFSGIGMHGKRVAPETRLADGDRVELLRALAVDPKEARRLRARRR